MPILVSTALHCWLHFHLADNCGGACGFTCLTARSIAAATALTPNIENVFITSLRIDAGSMSSVALFRSTDMPFRRIWTISLTFMLDLRHMTFGYHHWIELDSFESRQWIRFRTFQYSQSVRCATEQSIHVDWINNSKILNSFDLPSIRVDSQRPRKQIRIPNQSSLFLSLPTAVYCAS